MVRFTFMRIDICLDMCIGKCIRTCVDTCIDMCVDVHRHVYGHAWAMDVLFWLQRHIQAADFKYGLWVNLAKNLRVKARPRIAQKCA